MFCATGMILLSEPSARPGTSRSSIPHYRFNKEARRTASILMSSKSKSPTEVTLHVSPSPESSFKSMALITCLAFSNQNLIRWKAASPADAKVEAEDDIPPARLERTIRVSKRREMSPDTLVVTASVNGEVIGLAVWNPPRRLWRKEGHFDYWIRRCLELKDTIEDWLWPPSWYKGNLKMEYQREVSKKKEQILRASERETWYLDVLAVHPKFQGRGIGGTLLDWGLQQAEKSGEKMYLESTEIGVPLYVSRGFRECDKIRLLPDLVIPCMLWDPSSEIKGARKH